MDTGSVDNFIEEQENKHDTKNRTKCKNFANLSRNQEVAEYLATSKKQIIYSGDEIQERDSVLCGYWDLYYLADLF